MNDIYKQKGALKSCMARAAEHWEGYESDPLKAASAHAQRLAAGISHARTTTRGILEALLDETCHSRSTRKSIRMRSIKEYRQYVRDKAIHPVKQKTAVCDLRTYMTRVTTRH